MGEQWDHFVNFIDYLDEVTIRSFISIHGELMIWCSKTETHVVVGKVKYKPYTLVRSYAITSEGIPTQILPERYLANIKNRYKCVFPFGVDIITLCDSGNVNIIDGRRFTIKNRMFRHKTFITPTVSDSDTIILGNYSPTWTVINVSNARLTIPHPMITKKFNVSRGLVYTSDEAHIYFNGVFIRITTPQSPIVSAAPLMSNTGLKCYMVTNTGNVSIYDVTLRLLVSHSMLDSMMLIGKWTRLHYIQGVLVIINELQSSYIIDRNEIIKESRIAQGLL